MMMTTVLAVVLGLAPVQQNGKPQLIQVDPNAAEMVGHYSQSIDGRGRTHVRGVDRLGRSYDLTLDKLGNVEATVGAWSVTFHAADPA